MVMKTMNDRNQPLDNSSEYNAMKEKIKAELKNKLKKELKQELLEEIYQELKSEEFNSLVDEVVNNKEHQPSLEQIAKFERKKVKNVKSDFSIHVSIRAILKFASHALKYANKAIDKNIIP